MPQFFLGLWDWGFIGLVGNSGALAGVFPAPVRTRVIVGTIHIYSPWRHGKSCCNTYQNAEMSLEDDLLTGASLTDSLTVPMQAFSHSFILLQTSVTAFLHQVELFLMMCIQKTEIQAACWKKPQSSFHVLHYCWVRCCWEYVEITPNWFPEIHWATLFS